MNFSVNWPITLPERTTTAADIQRLVSEVSEHLEPIQPYIYINAETYAMLKQANWVWATRLLSRSRHRMSRIAHPERKQRVRTRSYRTRYIENEGEDE